MTVAESFEETTTVHYAALAPSKKRDLEKLIAQIKAERERLRKQN